MKTIFWAPVVAALLSAAGARIAETPPPSPPLDVGVDLAALDNTANACVDFYQHACGGFIARAELGPARPEISLADQSFDANLEADLTHLFAVPAAPRSELGRLEAFYASCINQGAADARVLNAWLERIDRVGTRADVQRMIRELALIGVDPFFSYQGQPDPDDPQRYRGEIDYHNLWQEPAAVERTFALTGLTREQAKEAAAAVTAIITALRAHRPMSDDLADYNNPRTPEQIAAIAPAIDWLSYLAAVGAPTARAINLTSPDYLAALNHELSTRSPAELRAYLRWSFLFSLRGELPAPANAAFVDVTPAFRVAVADAPKRCRDATVRALGVEFSRQFSERFLGLPAREAAARIAASIRDEVVRSVESVAWLSPAARRATADKLRRTDLKIGFPDRWPDVGTYPIRRTGFLANVLEARRFEARRAWHRAVESRSRTDWNMQVSPWVGTGMASARLVVPNGFPDAYTNSLIMTAAFLTPPRFAASAPLEVNYASFGDVFAHEFVHIAETHEFDANGRGRELWSPADIAVVKAAHQCVVDQADAAPRSAGAPANGASTVDENVADLGGLRLAWAALATRLGPRLQQPDAAGMTPAKRFFYKFAQTYCTAATPDVLQKRAEDDPHGLPSYRVNGPLSNLTAFAETFGCRAGAPMRRTPEAICRVW